MTMSPKDFQSLMDHCTVSVAILDGGDRGKNYSKCRGYFSTFNADNSAVMHWIFTKEMSFKRYWHEDYIAKINSIQTNESKL